MVEVGGGDDDFLADLPVDGLFEEDFGLAGGDCLGDLGPSVVAGFAVHVEGAGVAADDFVAETGELRVVVVAVQDEGQLVLVGFTLGTGSEDAVLDDQEGGFDGHVCLVGEDDGALD